MKRALGVIRLSVGSVGQTGDDTQRRRITKRVEADELDLVGFAEDIDVSASLPPWLRPDLGDWLNNRRDEFDVLYVLKIDRIVRSVKHLSDLLDWCDQHGKTLVSVEEGFDFGTSWGKTIAKILAVLAEAELDAIKARIKASRESMRATGRWPGGLVPFGRVSVKGEDGFSLGIDPEYGPVLMEMIRRFMSDKSFSAVATWLNSKAVLTAMDIARMRAAEGTSTTRLDGEKAKPRGAKWTPTAVQAVLTSRSLLGEYVRADGTVVRDADGSPVMRSEPVLTHSEWDALQEIVSLVKYTKGPIKRSPLLGVLFCDGCGNPLYYVKEGKRGGSARYRCHGNKSKGVTPCKGVSFNAKILYGDLTRLLMVKIGDLDVMEKTVKVDESVAVKVAVLDARLEQLGAEFKAGRIGAVEYASMVATTAAEREMAANATGSGPVEVWTSTGQTYRQWWESSTEEERREKLILWGVRAHRRVDGFRLDFGTSLRERLGANNDWGPDDPTWFVRNELLTNREAFHEAFGTW
ncbi:recombinase family protein [Streptomyces sp. NPDC006739]|uniref:recombinase family protein n=1 Tax=Streptomyces sp. NPDC006739 TaxID=3364763 RepID=UPI0036C15B3D